MLLVEDPDRKHNLTPLAYFFRTALPGLDKALHSDLLPLE